MICNTHAPSLSNLPPHEPVHPEYPFQHVCADYMELAGSSYGVVVDRFSGWFHVYKGTGGAHTNSRAEIAVKTAKRLLRDNTSLSGGLNTLRMTQALSTYRNTPDRDTGLSPAYMLLGRSLKEFLPNRTPIRNSTDMSMLWQDVANWRELALAKRSAVDQEKWSLRA